jgi:hypothetical protein
MANPGVVLAKDTAGVTLRITAGGAVEVEFTEPPNADVQAAMAAFGFVQTATPRHWEGTERPFADKLAAVGPTVIAGAWRAACRPTTRKVAA